MSVSRTDTVDATTVRDGWVILSIHCFEDWDSLEEPGELLRSKLNTYFAHVEMPRFQEKFHHLPARIELVSKDPLPEKIRSLCLRVGVVCLEG